MGWVFEGCPRLYGFDTVPIKCLERFSCDVSTTVDRSSVTDRHLWRKRWRDREIGVNKGEPCSSDRELRESRHLLRLPRVHKIVRVKAFDLTSDPARVGGRVKGCNVVHPGVARDQILPEGVFADTDRRDYSKARDDHPTGGFHVRAPNSQRRRVKEENRPSRLAGNQDKSKIST